MWSRFKKGNCHDIDERHEQTNNPPNPTFVLSPHIQVKSNIYSLRYYLDNKDILDFFDIYLYATCLPAIFLLVITVTTVITVISLRSAVFHRQSMTRAKVTRQDNDQSAASVSSKEMAVTRMLVGTSVVFVICVFPHMVFQVTSLIVVDLRLSGKYYNIVLVTWYFIGVFRVIRCSLNICVYCALGSKFRQTLKEMCCYCGGMKKQKNNNNTHMYEWAAVEEYFKFSPWF